MSEVFWQAKIWGLLPDPALKALHNNSGRGENSFWQNLDVMRTRRDNAWNPERSGGTLLKHIHLADYITLASERHPATDTLSQSDRPIFPRHTTVRTLQILLTHV